MIRHHVTAVPFVTQSDLSYSMIFPFTRPIIIKALTVVKTLIYTPANNLY